MVIAAPEYGLLLIPVAVLALLFTRAPRKRERLLRALAEPHLRARLIQPESSIMQKARLLVPIVVLILLVATLMRPQWGLIREESTTTGLDIIVVLDVSKSMLADDLSPTRLALAINVIERLTDSLKGDRIGLVAFSGSAFLVCPLTADYAIFSQVLKEVGPATIPKGGSSIASALSEAGRAFRGTKPGGRVLILVSDGEYHDSVPKSDIDDLRKEGVHLFAALAGTAEGGVIPLPDGRFVMDQQGVVVKSRASIATLSAIAQSPTVISVNGAGLEELVERARSTATETTRKDKRLRLEERFQFPLAAAILFWFGDLFLQSRRRRK